jgi:hypothetical protein
VNSWGATYGACRGEMPPWGRFLAERSALSFVTIDADLVPNVIEIAAAAVILAIVAVLGVTPPGIGE